MTVGDLITMLRAYPNDDETVKFFDCSNGKSL